MLLAASPRKVTVSPARVALVLAHGQQVGEQLAGVEVVGQRVDHRDPGVVGHLAPGRPGRRSARRSPRPDGRAPARCRPTDSRTADAGQLAVDHMRVAAELGDRRPRTTPGCAASACRRSSPPPAGRRAAARRRRGLELVGEVEDLGLLGRGEVVVGEEVPGSWVAGLDSPASSRIAGQASSNAVGVGVGEHQRRREPDPARASGR